MKPVVFKESLVVFLSFCANVLRAVEVDLALHSSSV